MKTMSVACFALKQQAFIAACGSRNARILNFGGLTLKRYTHAVLQREKDLSIASIDILKFSSIRSKLQSNPKDLWSSVRKDLLHRNGRKIGVEFSSPNIAKAFHIGHLRSTFLGRFIANLFEENGLKCQKINYIGDFGTQFGLLACGLEKFGGCELSHCPSLSVMHETYVLANKEAETNVAFEAVRQFTFRLENGDLDAVKFWQKIRDGSVEYLESFYDKLGIKFDIWQSESQFVNLARKFVEEKMAANVLQRAENGLIGIKTDQVFYDVTEKSTQLGHCRLIPLAKSDSTTLYLTRDVVAAIYRVDEMKFDEIIYVVDLSQTGHFTDLKAVLTALGREDVARKLTHVKFGLISKMSTRRGGSVFVEDMLEHGISLALEVLNSSRFTKSEPRDFPALAPIMAKTAFLVNDFKRRRTVGYSYDWSKILKPSGDNGYLLQACHARLCSIEEKFGDFDEKSVNLSKMAEFLRDPEAMHLIGHLTEKLPYTLDSTLENLDPSFLVQFSFELAHLANAAHKKLKVMGSEADVAAARFYMFSTARLFLGYVLRLIGTEPLSKL